MQEYPLNILNMCDKQYECKDIQRWKQKQPENFVTKELSDVPDVICYVEPCTNPDASWRIIVPTKC